MSVVDTSAAGPVRKPDSATYVRDEALELPDDEVATEPKPLPASLERSVETRSARLKRLAEEAVALLKRQGRDVTRSSLTRAAEEVDDDPTRLPRNASSSETFAGMPAAPTREQLSSRTGKPRYKGFDESAIDSNDDVRRIYEANADPSNLAIGKRRGRNAKRKRGVAVVPAHVMRRLKRDIARDYLKFLRLAEQRRIQLVHANAVILELRKAEHRRAAKKERDQAVRPPREEEA